MKLTCAIMLAVVLLAAGCKKKTVTPVTPPVAFTTDQYFPPLKVGNWWAYQRVDTSHNQTNADTIRVLSDTIINSITYYSLTGGLFEGLADGYYGDSAGTIISWPGDFAYRLSNKPNDSLNYYTESVDTFVEHTGHVDTLINVPAGAFTSIQVIYDVYYQGEVVRPGHKYTDFGKGVGVIYATTFFAYTPNNNIIAQLVGYHITP